MSCFYCLCCRPERHIPKDGIDKRNYVDIYDANGLLPGDHISISRKIYRHHAIVWSVESPTDVVVIHLSGNRKDVLVSTIDSSRSSVAGTEKKLIKIGSQGVRKYNHTGITRADNRKPHIVAAMILEKGLPKKYNVASFNCEHFATYCVTGKPYCKQTQTENQKGKNKLDKLIVEFKNEISEQNDGKASLELEEIEIRLKMNKLEVHNAVLDNKLNTKKYSRLPPIRGGQSHE